MTSLEMSLTTRLESLRTSCGFPTHRSPRLIAVPGGGINGATQSSGNLPSRTSVGRRSPSKGPPTATADSAAKQTSKNQSMPYRVKAQTNSFCCLAARAVPTPNHERRSVGWHHPRSVVAGPVLGQCPRVSMKLRKCPNELPPLYEGPAKDWWP